LLSPSKVSATHRTVLVVGDGLAEGVGDTLATGGLAPRINTLFADAVREARMPHSSLPLKLTWTAASAGRLKATSADWLPPPPAVPGAPPPPPTKNLFASTFLTRRHGSPDIVIILLGGADARPATAHLRPDEEADDAVLAAAATTAANILTLARFLSASGAAVCVGTVPALMGVTTPAAGAFVKEVNRGLTVGVAGALAGKYTGDGAAAAGRVPVGGDAAGGVASKGLLGGGGGGGRGPPRGGGAANRPTWP